MSQPLWKDPEFQKWEREEVADEPLRIWEFEGLCYSLYGYSDTVYPILSFKRDSNGLDEMESRFSLIDDWNYGDVL